MKKAENNNTTTKKAYPLMPYLVGLFITVVVLVLLSYLVQLRNKQRLTLCQPQSNLTQSVYIEV